MSTVVAPARTVEPRTLASNFFFDLSSAKDRKVLLRNCKLKNSVIGNNRVSGGMAKAVLRAIADHGDVCTDNDTILSIECNHKVRHVGWAIVALEEMGVIKVEFSEGRRTITVDWRKIQGMTPTVDDSMKAFMKCRDKIMAAQKHKLNSIKRVYDIDDLMQEVALFLLRWNKPSYDRFGHLAANAIAISARRKETAGKRGGGCKTVPVDICDDGSGVKPISYRTDDPAEAAGVKDEISKLREALEQVQPERIREMVKMRYLEDLSLDEMAERLGVTNNTVECGTRRGVKKLKAIMNI